MKIILESVLTPADASFKLAECSGRHFGAPYHQHAEIELTAILTGTGRMIVGDCFCSFRAGDFILQGKNLPHAYLAAPGTRASALYLQFAPDIFGDRFLDLPESRGMRLLLQRVGRGLLLSRRAGLVAAQRMQTMKTETGIARLAGLLEILDLAASDRRARPLAGPGYAAPQQPANTTLAAQILRIVDQHWQTGLSLTEAAARLHLHPQTLSRHCLRNFKRGWAELFIDRRLSEAARRLIESDEKILAVSLECGFNSLSHFNKLFLRFYGLTPRAYRQQFSHK